MVYPALLLLMRTPRLPVVDWNGAPTDLNGLVRLAERRNLVSARVPSHFNWPVRTTSYDTEQRGRSYCWEASRTAAHMCVLTPFALVRTTCHLIATFQQTTGGLHQLQRFSITVTNTLFTGGNRPFWQSLFSTPQLILTLNANTGNFIPTLDPSFTFSMVL